MPGGRTRRDQQHFSTTDPPGPARLPPPDRLVDADGHEDDGEQQGAEDAAQQHCGRREEGRLGFEGAPHDTSPKSALKKPK